MPQVYISIGSNVGDRRHYLELALKLLARDPGNFVEKVSSVYRSQAMTLDGQPGPEYLNTVCRIRTTHLPRDLLRLTRGIETRLGRIRHEPWAPRTIDLDILTYGKCRVDDSELTIPHPRLAEREFVLHPLAEITPDWRHPQTGHSISDLLEALADSPKGGKVLECCGSLLS